MRTDKAREIRKQFRREYFAMKEQLQNPQYYIPQTYADALKLAYELQLKNQEQATRIFLDQPKVLAAETLLETNKTIDITEFANVSCKKFGLGRNKIFSLLRNNNILKSNNIPYQRYLDKGYFKVIEVVKNNHINFKTLITSNGQVWLANKIKKNFNC